MIETTSYRHSTFDIRHSTFAAAFCFLASLSPAFGQLMAPQVGPPSNRLPQALSDIGIDQKLSEQVPLDLVFRDEQGRLVRLGDYFSRKPVVLSLVYFQCPMLCNQVLNGLASSLGVLSFDVGKQFDVVTVSFDPRD